MSDHSVPDRTHYVAKGDVLPASVSTREVLRRRSVSRRAARSPAKQTAREALFDGLLGAGADPGAVALLEPLSDVVRRTRDTISQANIESLVRIMLPAHDPLAAVRGRIEAGNAAARVRFLETVSCHDEHALAVMTGRSPLNARRIIRSWKAVRRVFAVTHEGQDLFPAFQFSRHRPDPAIQDVLMALPRRMTGWQTAFWFVSSNPWLDGAVPSDHLDEPGRLVQAAAMVGEAATG